MTLPIVSAGPASSDSPFARARSPSTIDPPIEPAVASPPTVATATPVVTVVSITVLATAVDTRLRAEGDGSLERPNPGLSASNALTAARWFRWSPSTPR